MSSKKFKSILAIISVIAALVVIQVVPIHLGLDLKGGSRLIFEAQATSTRTIDQEAIQGVIEVIRSRVDKIGLSEPIISQKGQSQIVVELPGINDSERAIKLIGETALLEFVSAEAAPPNAASLSKSDQKLLAGDNARLVYFETEDSNGGVNRYPVFLKQTVVTGADISRVGPDTTQYGEPVVSIALKKEGAEKFSAFTASHIGKPLAIMLDGKIISLPNIKSQIADGKGIISGGFTVQEMTDLVIKLKAGALPVPVKLISNKTVGPTLGRDSIVKSQKAGFIGFLILTIFMVLMYQAPGVMAVIGVAVYFIVSLAVLKLFGATLTLPGIAGLILTMGMAVDANVIIFERIKEERRKGQKRPVQMGFNRAFTAILDSNVTTLVATIVLFWLGTGTIKGFAITLSIGIIVSMFSAIFITRLLLHLIEDQVESGSKWMFRT